MGKRNCNCPACGTPLATDEDLKECVECSGEFGPCCMEEDGMCTGCSEGEQPGHNYVDQGE